MSEEKQQQLEHVLRLIKEDPVAVAYAVIALRRLSHPTDTCTCEEGEHITETLGGLYRLPNGELVSCTGIPTPIRFCPWCGKAVRLTEKEDSV